MYLPLLGKSGVDHAAVLRWVVEDAFQGTFPRGEAIYTADLEEIVEDLYEQLHWLLRENFAQQVSITTLRLYPIWLKGMIERMDRVHHHALNKDLEKMDELLLYWSPWYDYWCERPSSIPALSVGEVLQNYRTMVFAPTVKLPVKCSLKIVKKSLETICISV